MSPRRTEQGLMSCSYRVTISGLIPKRILYPQMEYPQIVISQSLEVFKQRAYLNGFVEAIPSLRWDDGLSQRISEVFSKSMMMWPFFKLTSVYSI